jgi:GT2 family glycosyltransferase
MNPDIRLAENPFPALLNCMATTGAALVAPRVLEADGRVADSMRGFPTVPSMVRKLLLGDDGRYAYASDADFCHPDWVAGMFMLFRHECFDALRGFDERFFMYYEDVDVCLRTWQAGMSVTGCLTTAVTHDARRSSHRNWRHLRWHLASMLRFFLRYPMPQRVRRCGPGAA